MMALKVLLHSPLSLVSQARKDDYEEATRGFGIALFAGTQEKAKDDLEVALQHTKKYWRISWGWQAGKCTNKVTGVAMWLDKSYYRKQDMLRWEAPPRDLAGRGGFLATRGGAAELLLGVLYFPPRPKDNTKMGYKDTLKGLFKWWDAMMKEHSRRRAVIVGMDLNDLLGMRKVAGQWVEPDGQHVGQFGAGKQGAAADMLVDFMNKWELKALNTMVPAGSTYFGSNGAESRIDFIVTNMHVEPMACSTLAGLGKKVQLIPTRAPRDHRPLYAKFKIDQLKRYYGEGPRAGTRTGSWRASEEEKAGRTSWSRWRRAWPA